MTDPIDAKLGAARTRLILEQPFVGALVMHLPLVAADPGWCDTVATDARALYFNPAYIARLSLAETQFVLAHEAMHCALGHFARRNHRVLRRWDVACDHAVNLILLDEGLRAPPGVLAEAGYRGLSAEEIYPLIDPETRELPLDQHRYDAAGTGTGGAAEGRDGGASRGEETGDGEVAAEGSDSWDDAGREVRRRPAAAAPQSPAASDLDRLEDQWKTRLAQAAHQARQAGRLGESAWRTIGRLIQPQLPWQALLARHLVALARDDYSFQRPSRRGGEAILAGLASGRIEVAVALDTSGSIGDEELAVFCSEVDALKGLLRARVTLHACDSRLAADGPWVFEPWESVRLPPRVAGGGSTSFVPVFEWVETLQPRPDVVLYFTDAEGDFPEAAPSCPVLWLVKGRAPSRFASWMA